MIGLIGAAGGRTLGLFTSYGAMTEAAERLAVMVDNADPYEPPKKISQEDIIMSASDFVSLDIPEKEEYLTPWLKGNSIGLGSGWRGIGKSFFAMGILNAISNGEPFGPWECKKAVPCLYLDGEMAVRSAGGREQGSLQREVHNS